MSNINPELAGSLLALIFGILAGFFFIASWTDAHRHMVPIEISNLTISLAFAFFAATVFLNNDLSFDMPLLLPRIAPSDTWIIAGAGLAVGLLGLLSFMKIGSYLLSWVMLFVGFIGFFVGGYSLLASLAFNGVVGEYWTSVGGMLLQAYLFLGFILFVDAFFGHQIGLADIKVLYAAGFGLAWWTSYYDLFIIMLVGFVLQGVLHIFAKPLNLGFPKDVKNGPIKQTWVKWQHRKELKANPDFEVPKSSIQHAVPFVPVLTATLLVGAFLVI